MASASVSMVMIVSLCSARSSGVAASLAPASVRGLAFAGVRFQTVTVWPTSIRRAAIAAPMRPRPAIPICISALRPYCQPHAREDAGLEGDIMSAAGAKGQVGVIGLGIMGGAIAKNLAAVGWHVIGFDTDAARCAE